MTPTNLELASGYNNFFCSGHFYQENSNEEANNEESNEDEESEAENSTLSATTPGYGEETTPGMGNVGLAAIQLPKKVITYPNVKYDLIPPLKLKVILTLYTGNSVLSFELTEKARADTIFWLTNKERPFSVQVLFP